MIKILLQIALLIPTCFSSNPCCRNNNAISERRCIDGSPLQGLSCPQKYLIEKDSDIEVDSDDHLNIASSRISPNKYCVSSKNDTVVYIVCFNEESTGNTIYIVHAVLELISVFFIVITIFVYLQLRDDLLDLQGKSILHSIAGLALSFLTLAVNQLLPGGLERPYCIVLAYIIYFSMLYSFFWLNVLSFHIWRVIVKPRFLQILTPYWHYIYCGFGCGGPTFLTIILSIAQSMNESDSHPGFGETKCWFKSTKTQFLYFYTPMAVLLCLNLLYYGSTIATLWRSLKTVDEKKDKVLKYRLLLCVKLFFIMGISWIFELLSAAFQESNPLQVIWHVTDVLNTLQGILIFLILVVFRKRVVRGLADRSFCGIRLPGRWRGAADDECGEIEEELNLSETHVQKN
ncbi:G-protein coupled receptor Mth-like Protein [Tribolium castaneum]|uniref:G-protein coupled receptor Mth-like Protein n=1 Tax=Tribolium castaneum TaxID=7070 RepID=A0A139WG45_TRICA|nr:PREDICTED: probable G-protein coupled receptor Mth-like 1 [Tribolium castaneum]XP_008195126.1 PREDICTED: probable G-protein coupled receptor Mth-like 1 [Tribolium castaneum]XP_966506.1 PREDICTED: probable G-protein coupled receptor Mth-like 1 [Tribolium castaneum]KYB26825.1 G-protein coupled receptor Mth-like Protein [Tribolium castaneum]|eukprot:XP_008195125.1 PREDICTED: probable G-protein coupled receptor Mth-like 1 [Tribolium castaneum]